MSGPPDVSLDDQIACAKRELAMRRRAYARWVDQGRMTKADADRETEAMAAIVATLENIKQPELGL